MPFTCLITSYVPFTCLITSYVIKWVKRYLKSKWLWIRASAKWRTCGTSCQQSAAVGPERWLALPEDDITITGCLEQYKTPTPVRVNMYIESDTKSMLLYYCRGVNIQGSHRQRRAQRTKSIYLSCLRSVHVFTWLHWFERKWLVLCRKHGGKSLLPMPPPIQCFYTWIHTSGENTYNWDSQMD